MKLSAIAYSVLIFFIMAAAEKSQAQLYPLATQYFDNQYIANPAMAGMEQGLRFNISFRKQWTDIPGSPITESLTGDYGSKRVGIGLNIFNNLEGLLRNTRVVGTYAYHLPLNGLTNQLNFGLSLGFINQHISNENIVGDPNDPSVGRYNSQQNYIDGDFGMSYTSDKLTIQASAPNMKSFFRKDFNRVADLAIFYTAVSYKVYNGTGINAICIEPKVCYRGVKGFDNMWDAGSNFSFAGNRFNLQGMYQSTGSGTFGFGFNYDSKWRLSSIYTTPTSALKGYTTTGNFELNIRLSL